MALTDRARNEPREVYDVWYLTSEEQVDLTRLMPEIDSKLEFRGRGRDTMGEGFERKEERLQEALERPAGATDRGPASLRRCLSCGRPDPAGCGIAAVMNAAPSSRRIQRMVSSGVALRSSSPHRN